MKRFLEWYWWRRQDKACLQLKARFRYTMRYPLVRYKPAWWRQTRYSALLLEEWLDDEIKKHNAARTDSFGGGDGCREGSV